MKYILVLIFSLSLHSLWAQPSFYIKEEILNKIAQTHGYKSLIAKINNKIVEQRGFNSDTIFDPWQEYLCALMRGHPLSPIEFMSCFKTISGRWATAKSIIYNSIVRSVTNTYFDGYSAERTAYVFDSLGLINKIIYNYSGEASSSQRRTEMNISYDHSEKKVLISSFDGDLTTQYDRTNYDVELTLDTNICLPLSVIEYPTSRKDRTEYYYSFTKGVLDKVTIKTFKDNVMVKKLVEYFYFSTK